MEQAKLALIVHDLKNALGALEAQLLGLSQQPSESSARQAHARCVELRQRFVQYLTVYGSQQELCTRCEDESPGELLEHLVRDHSPAHATGSTAAPSSEVQLVWVDPDATPPFWFFDARLVRMALDAALHNARRFATHRIELSARQEAKHLVLRVDDDGPGLGSKDPSELSTGLGTDLCQAVAQAHHNAGHVGQITLRNRPEGGARFELWLP